MGIAVSLKKKDENNLSAVKGNIFHVEMCRRNQLL